MRPQLRMILILLALLGASATALLFMERRPGYFANASLLGGILAVELVLACMWRFEKVFLPATMLCFLAADTANPFAAVSFTLRWLFLLAGAVAGFVIWMKSNREQHFEAFHLIALFCIMAAAASASASSTPGIGGLKAGSLFLMFLFAATGGRAAMAGRERAFVYGLVRACEVLVFLISGCYLLGFNMFGNPNNLGAFIGVLALPVLLWGGLMAENRRQRQRCYLALGLCGILLYVSVCRAAIMADVILVIGLTIGLRRPRMLVRAAFAGALLLELMAVANPGHMGEFVDTLTGRFLFKTGQTHTGVFGSRQSPWDDTVAAMKRHPWFGTGFGTSDVGQLDANVQTSSIYTKEGSNREHGSSYLAMAEYMGILGILPFLLLLAILARSVARVYAWMRNTGSPAHYSVPLALVTAAGLIHAGFEDWLVAPGSYLCLAFWVCAFLLIDMAPKPGPAFRAAMRPAAGAPQPLRQSTTPV